MGDFYMFICSVRAATLKFFGAVALSLVLLIALFALLEPASVVAGGEVYTEAANYSGIKTEDDRVSFLSRYGWEVSGAPVSEKTFTMPESFDRVLIGYNELQKEQGLDLSKYKKKKVTRYTYEITNYADYEGKVYANLIIYKNKVISADICSADPDGFVHGLKKEK